MSATKTALSPCPPAAQTFKPLAGLGRPRPGRPITWTKELAISELKRLAEKLNTTSSTAFQKDPEGNRLYQTFQRHEGEWGLNSWADFLKAAGLLPPRRVGQPKWLKGFALKTE